MTRRSEIPGDVEVNYLFSEGEATSRPRIVSRLRSFVREKKPDLVHASLAASSLATRVVARMDNVKAVESLVNISHEPVRTIDNPSVTRSKLRFHTLVDRVTMAALEGFHAVSQAVADSWINVVGLDGDRIRVIPRGVHLDAPMPGPEERSLARRAIQEELGLRQDVLLVLNVGRIEPQKGHRYLIDAFSNLGSRHPDVHLVLVGRPGNSSPAVERQVSELGLSDRIHLVGARADVSSFLNAADIFAFPSLFEGNGGNAMLEAMAAGLPILTTAHPPMTDLIPDSSVGLLSPRGDVSAITEALDRLATDGELRSELGRAARTRVETFLRPHEVAKEHESWYVELLE